MHVTLLFVKPSATQVRDVEFISAEVVKKYFPTRSSLFQLGL